MYIYIYVTTWKYVEEDDNELTEELGRTLTEWSSAPSPVGRRNAPRIPPGRVRRCHASPSIAILRLIG